MTEDRAAPQPTVVERRRRTFVTLDLSNIDLQEHCNGFANRVLWPILHYRVDLAEFMSVELAGYLRVNALFANALSPFLLPDDLIWVHDQRQLWVDLTHSLAAIPTVGSGACSFFGTPLIGWPLISQNRNSS